MGLNPLSFPKKPKPEQKQAQLQLRRKWTSVPAGPVPAPPPPRAEPPIYRTKKEEAEERARLAQQKLTIEIRGLEERKSGTYTLAFDPGQTLGYYLQQIDAKDVVTKAAVYDLSNLEIGRIKLRYVPTSESKIFVGPSTYSPLSHLQRTVHDAQRLARESPLDEASLKYGRGKKVEKTAKPKTKDEVEQW